MLTCGLRDRSTVTHLKVLSTVSTHSGPTLLMPTLCYVTWLDSRNMPVYSSAWESPRLDAARLLT